MKRTVIIIVIIAVALLGGGGIAFYYGYQGNHYITTDNAQVGADMITITPSLTGRIADWTAKVGDTVTAGQSLGRQETDTQLAISGASLPAAQQATLGKQLESKAEVTAPIAGKILQVSAVKGAMASASTPVAVVADTADAHITAYLKETDIANVKVGQKADLKLDAYPGKTLIGSVDTVGQAASSVFSLLPTTNSGSSFTKVTQLIPVRIAVADRQGCELMPGLNVSVKIYRDAQ